ncbi:hypothetical protein [Massilia sp. TSP1-1-2]|uniref:hypothetical protein n=1 Tax=unclassified Massilia TaxID=2609279 RepID=UPI003CF5B8F5
MKKLLIAAMIMTAAAGAMAQNLSLQLGQSGYYGSIDLGNLSRPPVIYQQPMIIQQMPQYRNAPPMYLRVPPGHAKKWSKHCAAYNACGRPVYFVQDSWYNNTYAPQYRRSHGGDGHRDENRYDNRRDNDQRGFRLDERTNHDNYDKHEGKHEGKHEDKHEGKHDKGHGKGHDKD